MSVNWDAVSAVATVAAAGFAVWALKMARDGVRTAVDTLQAGLFVQLSGEYASEDMHGSLAVLAKYEKDHRSEKREDFCNAYVAQVSAALDQGKLHEWNAARRRVSRFFLRAVDLVRAGLLDEAMLARVIRPSGLEIYLKTVIPLERAHNQDVVKLNNFDEKDVEWWQEFQERRNGLLKAPKV